MRDLRGPVRPQSAAARFKLDLTFAPGRVGELGTHMDSHAATDVPAPRAEESRKRAESGERRESNRERDSGEREGEGEGGREGGGEPHTHTHTHTHTPGAAAVRPPRPHSAAAKVVHSLTSPAAVKQQ